MPVGANMTRRALNARWCLPDTKDIKCQVLPVIDVVSVVMASAVLAPPDLWRLMCHIGTTWFGAILAPPGLWCCMCHNGTTWPTKELNSYGVGIFRKKHPGYPYFPEEFRKVFENIWGFHLPLGFLPFSLSPITAFGTFTTYQGTGCTIVYVLLRRGTF